jgi:CpeT protein
MRMVLYPIITLISIMVLITSCGPKQNSADLKRLVSYMTGSFSSQDQAQSDSTYFDIRLETVPIWHARTDGYWLYVEQAVAGKENKPYRQRIYHITQPGPNTFESDIYLISQPLRFAGGWNKTGFLSSLTPDSLDLKEGCSIILHEEGDTAFVGGTEGKGCSSELRGATYTASEVRITPDLIIIWDRGYDQNDIQVWGGEKGGYAFRKIKKSQENEPVEQ